MHDTRLAQLEFLSEFFKLHPELRANPLWLAGESYAGHYVPNLAAEILSHNR